MVYESYVKDLSSTSKKDLILIPLGIALLVFLAPTIFQLPLSLIFPAPLSQVGSLPAMLAMLLTDVLAVYLMAKVSKVPYADLGLQKEGWPVRALQGALGGIAALGFVVLVIWLLGGTTLTSNLANMQVVPFVIGLAFFMLQGTWEELIYRAYLMPRFSKVMGNVWAIIITSVLFTLGHSFNPGMQPLPIFNLFVASIVFSLLYVYTGNLLTIGLAHGLWNFSQGFVFGAEVSGNAVSSSIFRATATPGMDLISGGSFGFEGGLVTTFTGFALIVLFVVLIKRRQTREA